VEMVFITTPLPSLHLYGYVQTLSILSLYISHYHQAICITESYNSNFSHKQVYNSRTQASLKFQSQKMSTTIDVPESSNVAKEKVVLAAPSRSGGWKKGVAIMDFILRLGAIAAALGAAATMGTSDQTLPFFTQFFQFEASYDSFTTFQYAT